MRDRPRNARRGSPDTSHIIQGKDYSGNNCVCRRAADGAVWGLTMRWEIFFAPCGTIPDWFTGPATF